MSGKADEYIAKLEREVDDKESRVKPVTPHLMLRDLVACPNCGMINDVTIPSYIKNTEMVALAAMINEIPRRTLAYLAEGEKNTYVVAILCNRCSTPLPASSLTPVKDIRSVGVEGRLYAGKPIELFARE